MMIAYIRDHLQWQVMVEIVGDSGQWWRSSMMMSGVEDHQYLPPKFSVASMMSSNTTIPTKFQIEIMSTFLISMFSFAGRRTGCAKGN